MTQEEFFKRYTYSPSRDRIGGGGFGTVYKAKDNVLHRTVAIKVSEVKTTADGKKTFSLKDEFEALNHVPKHPNIANYEEFYSFEMPNGIFDYAVMQYYPDGNLNNAIKQGLTAQQKEYIARQLLEGIAFLHEHKVVHRDLKPGNILIVRDGESVIPLITDFGLSKAANTGDGSVFTNSFGGGTPRYSSPEQLQGRPLRFNTDLWSYGSILYEIFTGEQLFTAGSGAANTALADLEIYNKIVNGDVSSLKGMPEKWCRVAERCLVVDAEKRAKDAAELFAIIRGDEETEIGDSGSVGVGATASKRTEQVSPSSGEPSSPSSGGFAKFANRAKGNGDGQSPSDDEGTVVANQPQPKEKQQSSAVASPAPASPNGKSKKGLWIGLGIAAAVVVALLLLLKPKQDPTSTDPDTQAYEACQTVADYRAYMNDYGRNSLHYDDAKAFVERYVADSIEQARQAQALDSLRNYLGKYSEEDSLAFEQRFYDRMRKHDSIMKLIDSLENLNKKQAQAQQGGNGTANGHEYVDLGLPSGTLWATCNVGASKPEGYGNYYAWGETTTKDIYNTDTYKYVNGDSKTLTKYCNNSTFGDNGFTDNLSMLQGRDDPAISWGSGWHLPSKAQCDELLANTNNKWTTQNGVAGRLFTSKKNGKTLFLPAAGTRSDNELYGAGSSGYYWSRSLVADAPFEVWTLFFSSDNRQVNSFYRYSGSSVRPVREK